VKPSSASGSPSLAETLGNSNIRHERDFQTTAKRKPVDGTLVTCHKNDILLQYCELSDESLHLAAGMF
jgi:hypothetical protein